MIRALVRLVAVIAVVAGVTLTVLPAGAQTTSSTLNPVGGANASDVATTTTEVPAISGPTLTLDQTSVDPGQQVTVIFTGWQGRLVTVSVCGNLAKRGSADCNLPASQGVRLYHVNDTPRTSFVISAPPGTCPCVIRASSDADEVAYAPIEIRGVATGPVVDPFSDEPPLDVIVKAVAAPHGIGATLKSWLGGPTDYDVTVIVHNQATEAFSAVAVNGAVGRSTDVDMAGFDLFPGALGAGQTWTGTVRVTVPAPVIGEFDWRVLASGAGPVTETTSSTRAVPWLLIGLVLLLVGDIVAVIVRWVQRRRARRADAGEAPTAGSPDPHDLGDPPAGPAVANDAASPPLVSSSA